MPSLTRAQFTAAVVLSTVALTLSGCRVVGGIFKAGVWVGVLAVLVVIGPIAWGAKVMLSR